MGNFYTFALLELFLHCYTLGKKTLCALPMDNITRANFFYTSTASAASDKYDLWPRPRPSSLLLVIYQNFPGLLGMVEGGMYQVCAEYSRPRAQPQVTEAPV